MLSEWTFYFRTIDDAPATLGLFIDIEQPVPNHPHLLCVIVKMIRPSEHGMTDVVDPDALDVIDRALEEHMRRTVNAIYVGRESHKGERTFYFYAPSATGLKATVQQFMALHPKYRYRLAHRLDPQWSDYFNWLRPSPMESWFIKNMELIDTLEARGDDLEMPREIDHWLYFSDQDKRRLFVESIKSAGFLERESWFEGDPDFYDRGGPVDLPFAVQIYREDPLTFDLMQETVEYLYETASVLDGYYDGWEAFFVGEHEPAAVN